MGAYAGREEELRPSQSQSTLEFLSKYLSGIRNTLWELLLLRLAWRPLLQAYGKSRQRHSDRMLFVALLAAARASSDGGAFGAWSSEHELPVFNFTLDQTTAAGAATASTYYRATHQEKTQWGRNASDTLFELGNDRLVVLASSFGYVQVRQDELGPKLLNDVDAKSAQFGGGLVYVLDAATRQVLATSWFRPGQRRSFGLGFARQLQDAAGAGGVALVREVVTPFGDEPVVLSVVELTAKTAARNVTVVEVWGTAMYQQQQCTAAGDTCTSAARRAYQEAHYDQTTSLNASAATIVTTTKAKADVLQALPSPWDPRPPQTFMLAADAHTTVNTLGCDAAAFYGRGGAPDPALITQCTPGGAAGGGAMILERTLTLQPGKATTLFNVYGYVPSGYTLAGLAEKWSNAPAAAAARAALPSQWSSNIVFFNASGTAEGRAVSREVSWHGGMLRQALTRYDFFNESVLDQGSQYRYGAGFEGAARDPLQHALGLLNSAPELAKSVLRMQMQQLVPPAAWGPPRPAGPYGANDSSWNAAYALSGNGMVDTITYGGTQLSGASDLELYLLNCFAEYVLATKDAAFLAERIPYRFKLEFLKKGEKNDRSVLEIVAAAFAYLVNHTATGKHGIIRVQSGDWNDGSSGLAGCSAADAACKHKVQAEAESLMNTAMATHIMKRLAAALTLAHADSSVIDVGEVQAFGEQQTRALFAHGLNPSGWINRFWVGGKRGFVGTDAKGDPLGMTLEPQPWPLMAGVLNAAQAQTLVENLNRHLASKLGYNQMRTGHFWAALVHPAIMGVAKVNKSKAWDLWTASSLANEATMYPKIWAGIWTSADYVRAESGQSGGSAFPAFCTHRHAWPLVSLATALVGVNFTAAGATISPAVPARLGAFDYASSLVRVSRDACGRYSGSLTPARQTTSCEVRLVGEQGRETVVGRAESCGPAAPVRFFEN